jgi:RimJ/RimL family protein N-acetyltransferase
VNAAANDWLIESPQETLAAEGLTLRRVGVDDVADLVAAVNESLDHLRPWMAWAQEPATMESMGDFVARAHVAWTLGAEFQYIIRREPSGDVAGACGLHSRSGPGVLEIGYWVHADHLRSGIATRAARALTRAALELPEVSRVEISCVAANVRSAAVPRKLGYHLIEHSAGDSLVWALERTS